MQIIIIIVSDSLSSYIPIHTHPETQKKTKIISRCRWIPEIVMGVYIFFPLLLVFTDHLIMPNNNNDDDNVTFKHKTQKHITKAMKKNEKKQIFFET